MVFKMRIYAKKKWIGILLFIVVILVAAAVGIWQYQKEQAQSERTARTEEVVLEENQRIVYAQVKTINGNEMTYATVEVSGTEYQVTDETITTLIPVGTEVVTKLGTTTTFSRLSSGDILQMIMEDGEILSIHIMK